MAAARKTLDEACAREHAAALTWEKEKTIARHLEQQLAVAQGIVIPQDDDDDRSIDTGSNPDATLALHLHALAASLQNTQSWSRSFCNPRRYTTSGGATSCFSCFITTP
jgi:hypothetical protein